MSFFPSLRLDYIAWRAVNGLAIRREHLVERFGISLCQASQDLAEFQRLHPGALLYDNSRSTRAYLPAELNRQARRGQKAGEPMMIMIETLPSTPSSTTSRSPAPPSRPHTR